MLKKTLILIMAIFFLTGCATIGMTANEEVAKEEKKQALTQKIKETEKAAEFLIKKIDELKSHSIYKIYEAYNISLSQTNFELNNLRLELRKLEMPRKKEKKGDKKK